MGQFCMEITKQCVVALTWTLKDTLGEVLDVLDRSGRISGRRKRFAAHH